MEKYNIVDSKLKNKVNLQTSITNTGNVVIKEPACTNIQINITVEKMPYENILYILYNVSYIYNETI